MPAPRLKGEDHGLPAQHADQGLDDRRSCFRRRRDHLLASGGAHFVANSRRNRHYRGEMIGCSRHNSLIIPDKFGATSRILERF